MQFQFISLVNFVGMLEEIFLIIVKFDRLSDNTNILNTTISTAHRITMAPGIVVFLKATRASFQLENPLSMNALSRFELFNFPSL